MKTTKKNKKWKTTLKKMEDEPINQNQPNWLRHHCKLSYINIIYLYIPEQNVGQKFRLW